MTSDNTHYDESGTPFGRYVLFDEIGRGGMARIYRAKLKRAGFDKPVAVKRMLPALSEDPEFVGRFADEANIACRLNHSNIVQVLDFGDVDGEFYLAMEYVDGHNLAALIRHSRAKKHPFPLPAILYLGACIARGLGAAHDHHDSDGNLAPVVHRDISPQNVLVSLDGEVKVADFGIAKAINKASRTRTGMILGKCRHMAPEQARGERVSPRSDIFSAGTILYELFTDNALFVKRTAAETLQAVLDEVIPPPSSVNPNLPAEVDALVCRALSRDILHRQENGRQLANELEKLLHNLAPHFTRDDLVSFCRMLTEADRTAAPNQIVIGSDKLTPAKSDGPTELASSTPLLESSVNETHLRDFGSPQSSSVPPDAAGASVFRPSERPRSTLDLEEDVGPMNKVWWLVCLLAGVTAGAFGGLAFGTSDPAIRPLPQGVTQQFGGWQFSLEQFQSQKTAFRVDLRCSPNTNGFVAGPQAFSLRDTVGRYSGPELWVKRGNLLKLFFAPRANGVDAPMLQFWPDTGAPPSRFSLAHRGRL
jgi:eukaryotic-like serine/threonine-protein kinase